MTRLAPWPLAALFMLSACAKLGVGPKPADDPQPFGPSGVPPQLRAAPDDRGTPVIPGGNASSGPRSLAITPDDEMVFTDPDNPDAKLPELILTAPRRRGPWEQSEKIAKQRATREGKPLMIWFTDSARSPMCKALNQELFSNPDFESWASDKLIRLRVDAQAQVDDPDLSLAEKESRLVDLKNYVARLKKTYKVLGYPSVYVLNPSGEVVGRYRGYRRGEAELFWGRIKHAEAVSANAYQQWRKNLEKKGYREWRDRHGRTVFAKLTRYADGSLTLVEPDGSRSRTHEKNLSDQDQSWLASLKR